MHKDNLLDKSYIVATGAFLVQAFVYKEYLDCSDKSLIQLAQHDFRYMSVSLLREAIVEMATHAYIVLEGFIDE